jgi:hypothetical protein
LGQCCQQDLAGIDSGESSDQELAQEGPVMNASGLGDHFSACGRSWKEDGEWRGGSEKQIQPVVILKADFVQMLQQHWVCPDFFIQSDSPWHNIISINKAWPQRTCVSSQRRGSFNAISGIEASLITYIVHTCIDGAYNETKTKLCYAPSAV